MSDDIVLPPVLEKATDDVWYFALETKSGQQFVFGGVTLVNAEWLNLRALDDAYGRSGLFFDGPVRDDAYHIIERGMDIRLDSIAWVACGIS